MEQAALRVPSASRAETAVTARGACLLHGFISVGAVGQRLVNIILSLMVLALWFLRGIDGGCPELCWRNRVVRPASLGRSDAAVEFISTQSPDVAVAVPTRVRRAE